MRKLDYTCSQQYLKA